MKPVPGPLAGNTYVEGISRICNAVYTLGRRVMEEDFPLFVGGDHSIAVGTVAAAGADGRPIGLIWLEMPMGISTPGPRRRQYPRHALAILMGEGHPDLVNVGRPGPKVLPENVVMIRLRILTVEKNG